LGQRVVVARSEKFVARAFDGQQLRARGNEFQRGAHLVERAKAVARAVNEQRGRAQIREVRGAEVSRVARRMQRIGKQKQRVGQRGIRSRQHGTLASSVGVPAEEDPGGRVLPERGDGAVQALLVAFGVTARRAVRTQLAERQIAAQNRQPGFAESRGQRHEKRRVAIRSGAVGQNDAVARRILGKVKVAANGNLVWRRVFKGAACGVAHGAAS